MPKKNKAPPGAVNITVFKNLKPLVEVFEKGEGLGEGHFCGVTKSVLQIKEPAPGLPGPAVRGADSGFAETTL